MLNGKVLLHGDFDCAWMLRGENKRDLSTPLFPSDDHTLNPAAIFTCRIIRGATIKRQRLFSGGHNIYADRLGDILYLGLRGSANDHTARPYHSLWSWEEIKGAGIYLQELLPASIVTDLERVTHVVLELGASKLYGGSCYDDREMCG